jgi:hypothetical protein
MKKIVILIITVSILSVSCKKYLDEAYKNPNLPTYSPPENVLQSCISAMHRGITFDARAIGFYTQNFAQIPAVEMILQVIYGVCITGIWVLILLI